MKRPLRKWRDWRYERRHRDRIRRLVYREITLAEALAELDRDWQKFRRTYRDRDE